MRAGMSSHHLHMTNPPKISRRHALGCLAVARANRKRNIHAADTVGASCAAAACARASCSIVPSPTK
jgi:hypothetical protein